MTTITRTPDAFATVDPEQDVSAVSRRRRATRRVMTAALLIGIVTLDARLFAPYAVGAAVALRHPALLWVTLAIGAELASMAAAGHLQRRMLQAGGTRVTASTMISITYAANAVSMSLPAGFALSAGYMFRRLRQLGASVPIAGFTMLSTGVLSTVAYGVLTVLGVALAGGSAGSRLTVAGALLTAGAIIAALRLLSRHLELIDRAMIRVWPIANRLLRRPADRGLNSAIESTKVIREIDPRGRDWAAGLTFALVNWVGDLACLGASCHAVGAHRATLSVVLLA